MVMRGHIDVKEPFINHVKYNHQRRDLFHLWSAKNYGHTFGLREYNKFLSFKEYLEMPIDLIEDLLEGYGRGTEELIKQRKQAADKAASTAQQMTKNEEAAIRAAHKGEK